MSGGFRKVQKPITLYPENLTDFIFRKGGGGDRCCGFHMEMFISIPQVMYKDGNLQSKCLNFLMPHRHLMRFIGFF